jgi:hypothetical protein
MPQRRITSGKCYEIIIELFGNFSFARGSTDMRLFNCGRTQVQPPAVFFARRGIRGGLGVEHTKIAKNPSPLSKFPLAKFDKR